VVALLDTLTFPEVMTILVIALIVLGPEKLPGVARQAGQWLSKLRSLSQSLQSEVREVLDDPDMAPLRELGEFAARPKSKLAQLAREVTADTDLSDAARAHLDGDEPAETPPTLPPLDPIPDPIVATGPDHPMERSSDEP
jgi:sec-independent protein translocase protein TatB